MQFECSSEISCLNKSNVKKITIIYSYIGSLPVNLGIQLLHPYLITLLQTNCLMDWEHNFNECFSFTWFNLNHMLDYLCSLVFLSFREFKRLIKKSTRISKAASRSGRVLLISIFQVFICGNRCSILDSTSLFA